jgi:circadian clock protein KaiC
MADAHELAKVGTGMAGLDELAHGGLPKGRLTLVSGTAGTGKTILGVQFLLAGITDADEAGVWVAFEETPEDVREAMLSFGWDIGRAENENKFRFVDASPNFEQRDFIPGHYDLTALLSRIEHAVREIGAKRVVLDSAETLFAQFTETAPVKNLLLSVAFRLAEMEVTSVMTTERTEEYGPVARHEVEDFASRNVIILRNALTGERRRRTIEILKMRGTQHERGEYPFAVLPSVGIIVFPLSLMDVKETMSQDRVNSGIPEFDAMCRGGMFENSTMLLLGAAGTGKTLMCSHFAKAAADRGERCLYFSMEESRAQIFRNSAGWGFDFQRQEQDGLLSIWGAYAGSAALEDHLIKMKVEIERFDPHRVVIDGLSALESAASSKGFREFVGGFLAFLKGRGIAMMLTATSPTLTGDPSAGEGNLSTSADSVVLLRHTETEEGLHLAIAILKMRGSPHDRAVRKFTIDDTGMHIGEAVEEVIGILGGPVLQAQARPSTRRAP